MNNLHSSEWCSYPNSIISPLTSVQKQTLFSVSYNVASVAWCTRKWEIIVPFANRFHPYKHEPNNSDFSLDNSKSRTRSFNSGWLIKWGCFSFSCSGGVYTSVVSVLSGSVSWQLLALSMSKSDDGRHRKDLVMSDRFDCWFAFGIRYLMLILFRETGYFRHTEIAIVHMIFWFLPHPLVHQSAWMYASCSTIVSIQRYK